MAERKSPVDIYLTNEICSNCSAGYKTPDNKPNRYQCLIASLEDYLHRIPTAKDVMIKDFEIRCGRKRIADKIPHNCPNSYHSPDSLPLR